MSEAIVSRHLEEVPPKRPPESVPTERASTPIPPTRTPITTPPVSAVLTAIAGLGVFGLSAAVAAPSLSLTAAVSAVPVAGLVGATVLTGPALVAGHLFLRPSVATETPVAALGQGLTAAGSVAFGIAPAALFLVATTGLWPLVLVAGFAIVGLSCAAVTVQVLRRATGESPGFVLGWAVLAALVALRVSVAVGRTAWGVAS